MSTLNQQINWRKVDGLIPAIIQHAVSGKVLMLGYMSPEALEKTEQTKLVTFFSRSKNRLWTKGEASGNHLQVQSISLDCDQDTLLVLAMPVGPTCHTGVESCFDVAEQRDASTPQLAFLYQLETLLASRKGGNASTSYTASLFARGTKRMAQKVGEEGVEVALAATVNDREELANESADLIYHLLVLLQDQEMNLEQVIQVLQARHQK
ncbi:Histidine biosynthesis bifunctional protein HisIE [Vibrio stylophorae]|uniref:Histidine biosynthesis bifunctional protein HisIE n=1 Tax=Vibrio stylophorae TaxID=659351 RepID=A0ABM8ZRU4_9VIBR|nr:bifunctional phosphoribosyl-AMP cyclohydrolase/phosphoribosyl-ATP diphosphatase HisIE [Vibrio stylophorae]CAH0532966.1 Histidine biosynthesis bifunctional protein HisIE [Vibrio stylophorae]